MLQMSSSEAQNLGLVLLIIFFRTHLRICFSEDLALDDGGVCSTTSFPLLLLLVFISYCKGSPFVASFSTDPVAYTMSWEGGWEYSTICPSFDTSLIALCSGHSSDDGSFWNYSSFEL